MTARRVIEWTPYDGPNAADPTWVEVPTKYIRDTELITLIRGRNNQLQRTDTGSGTWVLDNRDRLWDPDNDAGIWFDKLKLKRRWRVRVEYPWLPGQWSKGNMETALLNYLASNSSTLLDQSAVRDPDLDLFWLGVTAGTPYGLLQVQNAAGQALVATGGQVWTTSGRSRLIGGVARNFSVGFAWVTSGVVTSTVWSTAVLEPSTGYATAHLTATAPGGTDHVRLLAKWDNSIAGDAHAFMGHAVDYGTWQSAIQHVGFVDSLMPEWPDGRDSFVHVHTSDVFEKLGAKRINNSVYEQKVLALGNVWYYRLGDPLNSKIAADSGPNHNDAVVQGNVVFNVPGALLADEDAAMNFNGLALGTGLGSGYVELGSGPVMFAGDPWSISFWVNIGDTSPASQILYSQTPRTDPSVVNGDVLVIWLLGAPKPPKGSDGTETTTDPTSPPGGTLGVYQRVDDVDVITFWALSQDSQTYLQLNDLQWHLVTVNRQADNHLWDIFVDGKQVWATGVVGTEGIQGSQQGYSWYANTYITMGDDAGWLGAFAQVPRLNGELDEVLLMPGQNLSLEDHIDLYTTGRGQWAEQLVGVRMRNVLEAIGIPSTDYDIEDGTVVLQPVLASLAQHTALEYLRNLEQGEAGWLYVPGNGRPTFKGHQTVSKRPYIEVQGVFGDLPGTVDTATGLTELPCYTPEPDYGDDLLYTQFSGNVILEDGEDGPTRTVLADPAIIDDYWERTLDRPGQLFNDDDTLIAYLEYLRLLYSVPQTRYRAITLILPQDSGDPFTDLLWEQAMNRELLDRIAVVRRPPPGGSGVKRLEQQIIGINWKCGRRSDAVTWQLGTVPTVKFLILDDAEQGLLDSGNLFGF